jgi:hypothetical protein
MGYFQVLPLFLMALRWCLMTFSWSNWSVGRPSPDLALHHRLENWILTWSCPVSRMSLINLVSCAISVMVMSSTIHIVDLRRGGFSIVLSACVR